MISKIHRNATLHSLKQINKYMTTENPEHNMENVASLNLNLTFKQYKGMFAFPLHFAASGNSFTENFQTTLSVAVCSIFLT